MTRVVAVRLRHDIRPRLFRVEDDAPRQGDHVVVETGRGQEMGTVCEGVMELDDAASDGQLGELNRVVRVASDDDLELAEQLARRGEEAMPVFRELIDKHDLDMKPVAADFLFSQDRAVFYFSAEERVDFRGLVRDLASEFHVRIDMRQIGVRDEARLVGGLSHCGEELCCRRFGSEFKPVSIRMAKEQDLPLNPSNISGVCGRLMCCLRYEFDAYKDFKSRAPKKGATIDTPLGPAKVSELNTPLEQVSLRLDGGKQVVVPLDEMDRPADAEPDENGRLPRPDSVSRETLQAHANPTISLALSAPAREDEGQLEDKAAEHKSQHRRSRRRHGKGSSQAGSSTGGAEGGQRKDVENSSEAADGNGGGAQHKQGGGRRRRRGSRGGGSRNSSSERKHEGGSHDASQHGQGGGQQTGGHGGDGRSQSHHGGRRRSTKGGSRQSAADQHGSGGSGDKVRPGQHSSGVRAGSRQGGSAGHAAPSSASTQAHRTPRRHHDGSQHDKNG
ncbi:MAG: stage 0 sporulation family protein [Coriobacteriales bacterium]